MALTKVKLVALSSAVGGFVAGGILMASAPVFAATNGSTTNATTLTSAKTSMKKQNVPMLLQRILHKNADQIASDLHITKPQVFKDLSSGKSLDDVAASSNVTQSQLQSDLLALIKGDLQARVSANHMTVTRETTLLNKLDTQLPKLMANSHFLHRPQKFNASMNVLNYVASKLNLTHAQLKSKLNSGQSISQIATAQGVSPATLQSEITQKIDAKINVHVKNLLTKTKWSKSDTSAPDSSTNNSTTQ